MRCFADVADSVDGRRLTAFLDSTSDAMTTIESSYEGRLASPIAGVMVNAYD